MQVNLLFTFLLCGKKVLPDTLQANETKNPPHSGRTEPNLLSNANLTCNTYSLAKNSTIEGKSFERACMNKNTS